MTAYLLATGIWQQTSCVLGRRPACFVAHLVSQGPFSMCHNLLCHAQLDVESLQLLWKLTLQALPVLPHIVT